MEMVHQGFTIKMVKNLNKQWVFRIYGERGQQVFKDQRTLAVAQDEINIYIRSSLKYPARTFTQWIKQATGYEWQFIQTKANAKHRDNYFKMYMAYCAANFFPVDFDYEF